MASVQYITLEQVMDRLGDKVANTAAHKTKLDMLILAASRAIDGLCKRPVNGFVGTPGVTRVYDVPASARGWDTFASTSTLSAIEMELLGFGSQGIVDIGWWTSVTQVATDADGDGTFETIWTTADYDLLPLNAAADGRPYTQLRQRQRAVHRLVVGQSRLQITGTHGEVASATEPPEPIREACYLLVNRLFTRRSQPAGISGSIREFGGAVHIPQVDPDVKLLLFDAGYLDDASFFA